MSFFITIGRVISRYLFAIPCILFGPFVRKKKVDKKDVKKILVIKLWALGDSIVLLPSIEALRKNYPRADIDVLAHPRNKIVFDGQKSISRIINFGLFNILKLWRQYDVCIDAEPALNVSAVIGFLSARHRIGFSHGIRSNLYNQTSEFSKEQHMVQNYLDLVRNLGINYNTDKLVPLVIPRTDKKLISEYIRNEKLNKGFVVGIAPGVAESVKHRMWPPVKVAQAADELVKKYKAKIVFIDARINVPLIESIQGMMKEESISAAGLFNVKQSTELMRNCDIIISNDSGPMHLAAGEGVKTIGLFGPNTPVLWAPYGKNNIALVGKKKDCPYMDNKSSNLLPKHLTQDQLTVMDAIKVKDVIAAVQTLRRK